MEDTRTAAPLPSAVLAVVPAPAEIATAYFARRLEVETDPSDVHADMVAGVGDIVVLDVRSRAAWEQGHVAGAVHCPHAEVPRRGRELVAPGKTAVVYCWGPGCNGATRAALHFARLDIAVKEMVGGFEWWAREGLPVADAGGLRHEPPDRFTAVTKATGAPTVLT